MRSVVVGSPGYFARHGRPKQPRELEAHDCVNFRQVSSHALYRWEFAHRSGPRKGRWFEIAVNGRLTVNHIPLAVRAACDGSGLAYVLEPSARKALADGRLESVLDDWLPPFEGFYLYYPSRFQVPPKLRVLIDFLRERQAMERAPAPRRRASRGNAAQSL
jgi:DNA-binding transcriptional LysR family regulator